MKKLFGCLLFLAFCISLIGQQKISYSVYGGPQYAQPNIDTINNETYMLTMFDSTGYWRVPAISRTSINAVATVGFDIGASIHIPINDQFSIRTGIGLQNQAFKLESEFLGTVAQPGGVAEFVATTPSSGGTFSNYCDDIIRDEDPPSVPLRQYDFLHLNIPLAIEIQLLDWFVLSAGVEMSTPIWTAFRTIQSQTDRETFILNDGTEWNVCTITYSSFTDNSGNNIRNMVLGTRLGLAYQLKEKFSIGLNFSGSLNSIFAPNPSEGFFFSNGIHSNDIRAVNRAVGLEFRYRFGKDKNDKTN